MPYEIRKDGSEEKPYCVYNKLTDERAGCSVTEEEAQAHMRALYAHETKEAVDFIAVLKSFFETVVHKLGNIGGSKPRGELEDSDFVFSKERKFPVVTPADVSDAVSSWGRYKGEHTFAEFKARLISLCRRKGRAFVEALPKAWDVKETREITTFKDANDVWRWITVSSTGFLDRDNEIVSSIALKNAVEEAEQNGWDPGYLTYWHERAIRVGKCDARFVEDFCLVELGTWFTDEVSEALRKDVVLNPELWAISTEFLGSLNTATVDKVINGTKVDLIWNKIGFKEQDRSILPAWRASNTFSMIESQGGVLEMREEKQTFLRERVGEEIANKVVAGVDAINTLAKSSDAVVKEETTEDPVVTQEEQSAKSSDPAPSPATDDPSPLNALRVFAVSLDESKQKELAAIIIALAKALEVKPVAEPEDETPPDKTGYDSTANDETAKEDTSQTSETAPAPSGETVKQDTSMEQDRAEIASLKEQVATLKESLAGMGGTLVELRDALVRKQQEDTPRGVLQRASAAEDNVITSKEEVEAIKVQAGEVNEVLASMTQSIMNLIGGMN